MNKQLERIIGTVSAPLAHRFICFLGDNPEADDRGLAYVLCDRPRTLPGFEHYIGHSAWAIKIQRLSRERLSELVFNGEIQDGPLMTELELLLNDAALEAKSQADEAACLYEQTRRQTAVDLFVYHAARYSALSINDGWSTHSF